MRPNLSLTTLLGLSGLVSAKHQRCKARDLPKIDVWGLKIIDLHAVEHHNYTDYRRVPPPVEATLPPAEPLSFCNITVTYTHPGQNDVINVYIWLPLDDWNGRYLGLGGGGFSGGSPDLSIGISNHYATASTDTGHSIFHPLPAVFTNAEWWLFHSPGNIDWNAIQNFASRTLDDLPKIAKQVIAGFYGTPASHSYWVGCSTGGRQGLMSAQRYPDSYNGILANAPAINFADFVVSEIWPVVIMNKLNYYPPNCEMSAIRAAAIRACDALDGVEDGMISAPGLCTFNATSIIGTDYTCEAGPSPRQITKEAALLANAVWQGPIKPDGTHVWPGLTHETMFSPLAPWTLALAHTTCDEQMQNCKPIPFPISANWIKYFCFKDPEYDTSKITEDELWRAWHISRNEFGFVQTNEPDLSYFREAGGKMITWHGLADELIFPNGSSSYYEKVLALDPAARDFYRYFEAPGAAHCQGGHGALPTNDLEALVKWVEEGVAPEKLLAATKPTTEGEKVRERILCPYPQVAAYVGGDEYSASSFECRKSFEVVRGHTEL